MKNYIYNKNKHCIDCGILISNHARKCRPCTDKAKRKAKSYCRYCNKIISRRNRTKICMKCRIIKMTKFPNGKRCIDCNKLLSHTKAIRCQKCSGIARRKTTNYCMDCGIKPIAKLAKRCWSCEVKRRTNPAPFPKCKICRKKLRTRHSTYCQSCCGKIRGGKKKGTKLTKEHKKKIGKNSKIRWKSKEYRNKTLKKIYEANSKSPNKLEKIMITICKPFGYKFVGDGKLIINGFCPDFVHCKQKCIIEFYGDYWHNKPSYKERDKRRLNSYKKHGYKTLIIWEHELKDINKVKLKIKDNYAN